MSLFSKLFVAPLQLQDAAQDLANSNPTSGKRDKPLDVIIVGGSCAGLMSGILLKRQGHNVRILDSAPSPERQGTAAGIGLSHDVKRFFREQDRIKDHPFGLPSNALCVLDDNLLPKARMPLAFSLTSWDSIYYRLRANFDYMASNHYPKPPAPEPEEGDGVYETGRMVMGVDEVEGKVVVVTEDASNPRAAHRLMADLVVVADGANSRIRKQLQPQLQREEPGYVVWRGVVRCKDLSKELLDGISGHMSYYCGKYNYILTYAIPGENGSIEPDDVLMNFVWYFWLPRDEIDDILTDTSGHQHRTTLPVGSMRPEVWNRQLQQARKLLPAALAELVEKIPKPFVSIISNITSERAAFFDGKLFLIGDALAQIRPHQGTGTNKAAIDAMLLAQVTEGRLNVQDWEEKVLTVADRFSTRATAWGSLYLCTIYGILKTQLRVHLSLLAQRFCKYWFGTAYPRTRRKAA